MSTTRIFGVAAALLSAICACSGDDAPPPPPPPTVGSAVITWVLQDESGNPLTCEALSLSNASISLGADTVDVPCGDEQRVRFEMLTPGTYGVTLRLEVAGRGELLSQLDNVQVVANEEATLEMIVEIDTGVITSGSIMFRWTVAGGPAAANCGTVGAETVHFQTQESSIAQFTVEEDCTDGEVLIDRLMPGIYLVRAEMRDASGAAVGLPYQGQIRVNEGERTVESIGFAPMQDDPASFYGTWTITSSAASESSCTDAGGDYVRVSLRTVPMTMVGVEIASATIACEVGEVTMENLFGGSNRVRASFILISDFVGPLDTQTSTSFFLVAGRTSTITADFDVVP
jgi:hypothetical protein